jgi:hypothetical protein
LTKDDKTVSAAHARERRVVHLLTGPPENAESDQRMVASFMQHQGTKIVSGGTTARIVSRVTGHPVAMRQEGCDFTAPPGSILDGVELVTEGAVTLTQAFRLLDGRTDLSLDCSAASELAALLRQADCVRFTVGEAVNSANASDAFLALGICQRSTIVSLLKEKLESMGKLVTVVTV